MTGLKSPESSPANKRGGEESAMHIGRIERVPLREVWQHEAHDFTTWLQDNIELLNETVGLELSSADVEQAAGDFSVDIIAEDLEGNPVIIENQLGQSDHDHLGKLITYLTAIEARSAIWIASDPRPEHVSAISWLNESSSADFYFLKVEAIRIEESVPAPLFTQIVGPSDETRQAGETKRELSERHFIRRDFWSQLLSRAKERTKLHANISPSTNGWVGTGAGLSGLAFNYVIKQHSGRVELYIDRGKNSRDENKEIFDALKEHRADIEETFGSELRWQRLDEAMASRISVEIDAGGYRDDEWKSVQDMMIDTMIRFAEALQPHIEQLQI